MRSTRVPLLAALAATLLPSAASAQTPAPAEPPPRPIQVGLTFGTRGLGVEAARMVAPRLALRAGASGAGGTASEVDVESLSVDASIRLVTVHALADVYPFQRASLHLTGGVVAGTTSFAMTGRPREGAFELNGVTYAAGEVGSLRGRVSLPRTLPYLGLGFGRPSSYGFRFVPMADLGVAFGRATTELRAENAPNDPRLAADVEAQRVEVDDNLGRFPFFPVLTMTFAWRF